MTRHNEIATVADLQDDRYHLLIDSQDTADLRHNYPDYDSFLVVVEDGTYTEIWGMNGTVPYLGKTAYRLA